MRKSLYCVLFSLISIALLNCGKYKPEEQFLKRGEWIYSLRVCYCGTGQLYIDTLRPIEGPNGVFSAKIQISDSYDENTVLMYLNENLASAVQFDYLDLSGNANYIGNFDEYDSATRLYSEIASFRYSLPNDVAGYSTVIETPDFPFKSDIYENEMDTFTVNFFKFID
jgi:hypothetical protein